MSADNGTILKKTAENTEEKEGTDMKTLFPKCEVCGKSHFEIACHDTPMFEARIRKFIENIHTGHYDYDEWCDVQVSDLMDLIASSNRQAVQAFGEKVLKEAKQEIVHGIDSSDFDDGRKYEQNRVVSVITSLMKESK